MYENFSESEIEFIVPETEGPVDKAEPEMISDNSRETTDDQADLSGASLSDDEMLIPGKIRFIN